MERIIVMSLNSSVRLALGLAPLLLATPPAQAQTYTAGAGLTLSGNKFSVATGGITGAMIGVPLSLSGSSSSPILTVTNTGSGYGVKTVSASGTGTYGTNNKYGNVGTLGDINGFGVYGSTSAGPYPYGVLGINRASGNGDYGILGGVDPVNKAPAGVFGSDISTNGGNGVFGDSTKGSGVSGVSSSGFGVLGVSTSNDGMQGQTSESGHSGVSGVNNGSGHGVFGVSRSSGAYGFLGGTDPAYNAPAGVFGTNTTNSGNGVLGLGTSSTGVAGVSTSGDGVYATTSTGLGLSAVATSASGQAVLAQNPANKTVASLCDQHGDGVYAYAPSGQSAIRCDGVLTVNGHASVHVLQITGGSDVAEPYTVQATDGVSAVPGLVVSIDPAHTGQMRVSRTAYDPAVAGILSGAGGVQPGLTLVQTGTIADGTLPVACSGRVWCFCDAGAGGPITPGDLLTTSGTPGHAMKAGSGHELRGAILGKAMSSLPSGRGLVLVLVTLE